MSTYGIIQTKDVGKTLTAVAMVKYFILERGYDPREVYANFEIRYPGCHALTSEGIRQLIGQIMHLGWRHKIIVIDEANTVFPARLWGDKERTKELLSLWQDVKMFHKIIYTSHIGRAVDLLLRQATDFDIIPWIDRQEDCVNLRVINGVDLDKTSICIPNASSYYKDYNRWGEIVAS